MSPTLFAVLAFVLLGTLHVVLPRLLLQARRRQLQARCRQLRAIALTFDDGPSPVLTPLVVERLNRASVPGTFFMLGERVADNESTVRHVLQNGHQIGSHGSTHVHHIWSWPWDGFFDTRDGFNVLRAATGASPNETPFRPPYGKLNLLSLLLVWWRRAPIAMWTHDSGDTRDKVGDRPAISELVAALRRDGGGVVLLHDFDRGVAAESQQVLAAVDAILQLQNEGFTFRRFTDVLPAAEQPSPAAI